MRRDQIALQLYTLRRLAADDLAGTLRAVAAAGYLVQPYAEGVWDEAPIQTGAWIAAGQMWGTVGDLARWADVAERSFGFVKRDEPGAADHEQ